MNTAKIQKRYDKATSYEKIIIDNAILDRVKKDWKSIPELAKKQVLTLAKRHNRLNEFINL